MEKVFGLGLIFAFCLHLPVAAISTQQVVVKSFIVDLTPLAGLSNLTSLQLDQNQIIDIKPLAKLSKLTSLYLDRNQIVDIQPLAKLRNLTQLYLNRNQIAVKTCPLKPESICRF
jgi:internalin A